MKQLLEFTNATRTRLVMLIAIMPLVLTANMAEATAKYQLNVTYSEGSIESGPLSFGLSELPNTVTATFTLGPGEDSGDDVFPGMYFDKEDVYSASISFGDASWALEDMEDFSMLVYGTVNELTYNFSPVVSATAEGPIVLNFPLNITGTDSSSGSPFKYVYNTSIQTFHEIVLTATIDVKPGSDPNCFNINGHGVVPVAILGNTDFDVSQIDWASLLFGGLQVRVRGNRGPVCAIEYSNTDAYQDLVCHFEDDTANWSSGLAEATLTGNLLDGTPFEGTDSICIVP